jgi:hypothetical protein
MVGRIGNLHRGRQSIFGLQTNKSRRKGSGIGEFFAARFDRAAALLAFLHSTYEAAANLAGWERSRLERAQGKLGRLSEDAQ